MADDVAERALSDSESAGVGAGKALVRQQDGELSTAVEAAQDFVAASRSKATLRAYKSEGADIARTVLRMIKRRCAAVGLDPARFASHSLRSGFITSAATEGAPIAAIALHDGHKKFDTTMGYVQTTNAFRDHAGKKIL
jgi:hypothetical protein